MSKTYNIISLSNLEKVNNKSISMGRNQNIPVFVNLGSFKNNFAKGYFWLLESTCQLLMVQGTRAYSKRQECSDYILFWGKGDHAFLPAK